MSARTESPGAVAPPLEAGDHLTRPEFERRYAALKDRKKAELIEGVVFMPSPVGSARSEAHASVMAWLGVYRMATPHVHLHDSATVRLDLANEPQPDALLRIARDAGGAVRVADDDTLDGPPEFIVEIAGSSASYDLHDKRQVYQRSGGQEYMVWRIYDEAIDWWGLSRGRYVALAADAAGIVRSQAFPGLWLDLSALLRGDLARVSAIVQEGLADAGHRALVSKLAGSQSER